MIPTRGNKYGAKRSVDRNGRSYASTAEKDRAEELLLLQEAGHISDLLAQPVVRLAGAVNYRPDFSYWEKAYVTTPTSGRMIYEDVKGVVTERFAVICQLWAKWGPATLRITQRSGRKGGFRVTREILPKGEA